MTYCNFVNPGITNIARNMNHYLVRREFYRINFPCAEWPNESHDNS